MEKLITCFLLLAVLNCVSAEDQFFGEGGELLLRPRPSGKITGIQWKHNNNLVAEWVEEKVDLVYYGGFNGRTTLNLTTGYLEIRNMTLADSGEYSVEINNRVQPERYNAKLIKAVPKPVVLLQPLTCTAASKNCTLTCDGNSKEAEPVTYSWKMGGEWMDGEKSRMIVNAETIQSVKSFSCRMKNPISEEESDPKPNPFFEETVSGSSGAAWGVGLCVLFGLAALVGVGFWKREYIKKKIFPKKSDGGNPPSSPDGKSSGPEGERLNPVPTDYTGVQVTDDGPEKKEANSSQSDPGTGEANHGKTGEENGDSAL